MDEKIQNLIDAAKAVLNGHDQTGCDGMLTVCNANDIIDLQHAVCAITGELIGNEIMDDDTEDEDDAFPELTDEEEIQRITDGARMKNMEND